MKNQGKRVDPNIVGVASPRPYGHHAGRTDAVPYHGLNGARPYHAPPEGARPYISDRPYIEPYSERAVCAGTRTDGHACKAKAVSGERFCTPHASQG